MTPTSFSWLPRFSLSLLLTLLMSGFAMAADYLVGEVRPLQRVVVSAEVDGVVSAYRASLGDAVEQGQLLLTLDDRDATLAVALSRAQLSLSRAEHQSQLKQLKRLQALIDKQTLAQSELDDQDRITQISAAQVQVDSQLLAQSLRQQQKNRVQAPFAGVVAARLVDNGQWVNAGDPLYELVDVDRVIVRVVMLEQDYVRLTLGDEVQVTLPSLSLQTTARVLRVSPSLLDDGRGYPVELELDNPNHHIKPGFRVEVSLLAGGGQ
ncbi:MULTISPECIES: efflux RND transporter periplasmic adaptor subunit [Ferrimonas]|uniref:efflux RND transporter periplasmic adaptor subunit n=1 Tax=Ferrimonas TaxID=44011 RepID=UPI000A05DABA|nr:MULTISPECIES: efflux RND transporter periplasmic adaptor subunit [Ferrimonas]USD36162.1 efflux RND transporter periplasmic adaptor subunit [Ferrimonas sp. SCSIO 43195]